MSKRASGLGGLVVALTFLAVPCAAPAAGPVPVVPCPVPPATYANWPVKATPIPARVSLPTDVTVPANATLYGTTYPGLKRVYLSLAPSGYSCGSVLASQDGGLYLRITDPSDEKRAVDAVFQAGGIAPSMDLSCPYIPSIRRADASFRGSDVATACARPRDERVTQLPTGSPALVAAAVRTPATVKDPHLRLSGDGRDTTFAVFTGNTTNLAAGIPQEGSCNLPVSLRDICSANLALFLSTSDVGSRLAPTNLRSALTALADVVGAEGSPMPKNDATCRASADLALEREIHRYARSRIPIPAATIRVPSVAAGQVTVSFILGDAQTCKNNLSSAPSLPGIFTGGEVSFGATDPEGNHYGPFKYDAPTVSWVPVPGMPEGQELTTQFEPASAEASLNVHPAFSFGRRGLKPALTVAETDLHALTQRVTLVRNGQALLQVSLGPTIAIEAQVDVEQIERNAEDAKASEGDTVSAADDAAEMTADDIAAAVDEAASEFYGVDIERAAEALYAELEPALASALESDPVLIAYGLPTADVVPDDVVTTGEAAAVDAEMGAGVIELEESDLLLLLLL